MIAYNLEKRQSTVFIRDRKAKYAKMILVEVKLCSRS